MHGSWVIFVFSDKGNLPEVVGGHSTGHMTDMKKKLGDKKSV